MADNGYVHPNSDEALDALVLELEAALIEKAELEAALVIYANRCQRLEYELSRRK